MPRKTVHFQDKRGDWKSTNKKYGNLPKYVKRSMRTRQRIMKQTRPTTISREQKVITQKDENITLVSSSVTRKNFPNKDQHAREDNTVYANPTTGIISVTQSEEASRYTPKKTVTTAEVADDESIIISKIGGKDPRVVSETQVRVIPPPERFTKTLDLEAQFKKWNQLPPGKEKSNSVLRLSNQELRQVREGYEDIPTGGINNKSTVIEKNLREKITKPTSETRLAKKQENASKNMMNNQKIPNNTVVGAGIRLTEEHREYWQKLTQSVTSKKDIDKFEKDLEGFFERKRFPNNQYPLREIRPYLEEKGYSRYEQDKNLYQLGFKNSKIDLQSASNVSIVKNPENILVHPQFIQKGTGDPGKYSANALNYVSMRKQLQGTKDGEF